MRKISIGIPTFNREKQLENQINKILNQDLTNIEEIIVLDNNSDYDVESLISQFDCSKIRLEKNAFNIKMATNMQMPFLFCKTEWLWLLSDDDEVHPDSISIIVNEVNNCIDDIGMIKFSIDRLGSKQKEFDVSSLEEFIDYYYNEKKIRRGELVFISTNVYNIHNLRKFLGTAFEYSYTYIGFLIPILFALNQHDLTVKFSSRPIVKYLPPREGNYSFATVGMGLSTLSHIPLNLSKNYWRKFLNITMSISHSTMIRWSLEHNSTKELKITYNNIYRYYIPLKEKVIVHIFLSLMSNDLTKKLILDIYEKRKAKRKKVLLKTI